jgi:hypothetical protein
VLIGQVIERAAHATRRLVASLERLDFRPDTGPLGVDALQALRVARFRSPDPHLHHERHDRARRGRRRQRQPHFKSTALPVEERVGVPRAGVGFVVTLPIFAQALAQEFESHVRSTLMRLIDQSEGPPPLLACVDLR